MWSAIFSICYSLQNLWKIRFFHWIPHRIHPFSAPKHHRWASSHKPNYTPGQKTFMTSWVNPSCWRVFWESQPNLISTFSRIVCEERWIPQRWDLRIKGSFRSFTNIQNPVRCGIVVRGYIGVFSRILDVFNSYSSYDHTCIYTTDLTYPIWGHRACR